MQLTITIFIFLITASCATNNTKNPTLNFTRVTSMINQNNNDGLKEELNKVNQLTSLYSYSFIRSSLEKRCSPEQLKMIVDKSPSNLPSRFSKSKRGKDLDFAERLSTAFSPSDGIIINEDIDRPSLVLLSLAAQSLCLDGMKVLVHLMSPMDFADVLTTSVKQYSPHSNSHRETTLQEELIKRYKTISNSDTKFNSTVSFIIKQLKQDCQSNDLRESCSALGKWQTGFLSAISEHEEKRRAEHEYWSSPTGLKHQACNLQNRKSNHQDYIDHQKKIAAHTGVANTKILYESGSIVVQLESQINQLKSDYRISTGKKLDLQDCDKFLKR